MKIQSILVTPLFSALFLSTAPTQFAQAEFSSEETVMDEWNPLSENAATDLLIWDQEQKSLQGDSEGTLDFDYLPKIFNLTTVQVPTTCYRWGCPVFFHVIKSEQRAYLYHDFELVHVWKVSTGTGKIGTPDFDRQPNGRIYDYYESSRYPGGGYRGLGNMPYAIFIDGGFAIHGTGRKNWPMLGQRASHGCVRLHPDNAFIFNRMVRGVGVKNTWITIE